MCRDGLHSSMHLNQINGPFLPSSVCRLVKICAINFMPLNPYLKGKKKKYSFFLSLSLSLSLSRSALAFALLLFSLSPPPSRCPSFFSFFLFGCFSFLFLFSLFFFFSPRFSLALWDLYFFSSSIQVFFILFSE